MANTQKEKSSSYAAHKPRITQSLISRAEQQGFLSKRQGAMIRRYENVNRIDEWALNGLIDSNQREQLYELVGVQRSIQPSTESAAVMDEKEVEINTHTWMRRMSLFAIGCIALGVVAMIAANWQSISDTFKLGGYFVGFIALIVALMRADSMNKKFIKECLLWGNIGWIFAGIALIGQIYHLQGSFWNALLLGSLLSIPYILASSLSISLPIWMVAYCFSVIWGTGTTFVPLWTIALLPIVLWKREQGIVSVFWWLAFIGSLIRTDWFIDGVEVYCRYFVPVTAVSLIGIGLFGVVGVCRRFVGVRTAFTQTAQVLTGLIVIGSVVVVDLIYSDGGLRITRDQLIHSGIGLVVGMALTLWFISMFVSKKNRLTAWKASVAGFVVALTYCFATASIFGMIFTLICLLGLSILAARRGYMVIFNFCMVLMVLRVIVAYGGYILSLMSTGIGLILFGAILLAGIWFYFKGYPVLVRIIKEMSHE